jgi:hypothetical protein
MIILNNIHLYCENLLTTTASNHFLGSDINSIGTCLTSCSECMSIITVYRTVLVFTRSVWFVLPLSNRVTDRRINTSDGCCISNVHGSGQ